MKIIEGWSEKKLVCFKCGEKRSVKYEYNGKTYCNKCIIFEKLKEIEGV